MMSMSWRKPPPAPTAGAAEPQAQVPTRAGHKRHRCGARVRHDRLQAVERAREARLHGEVHL